MPKPKLILRVIVNGVPADVETTPTAMLRTVAAAAMQQSHNVSDPSRPWELRDSLGNLIAQSGTVRAYGFVSGETLYLQPAVGIAGAA